MKQPKMPKLLSEFKQFITRGNVMGLAVGMIIGPTDAKDIDVERLPELNLPKLGIGPEHYEAIEKAVKDLERQGIAIEIIKE